MDNEFNTMIPKQDRVVVKRAGAMKQTASGIILPGAEKDKPMRGQVIAVGPGRILPNGDKVEIDLEPGDFVVFGKYSGTEINFQGHELLIMREEDIMCVLENQPQTAEGIVHKTEM